jgi:hypothetical protein
MGKKNKFGRTALLGTHYQITVFPTLKYQYLKKMETFLKNSQKIERVIKIV